MWTFLCRCCYHGSTEQWYVPTNSPFQLLICTRFGLFAIVCNVVGFKLLTCKCVSYREEHTSESSFLYKLQGNECLHGKACSDSLSLNSVFVSYTLLILSSHYQVSDHQRYLDSKMSWYWTLHHCYGSWGYKWKRARRGYSKLLFNISLISSCVPIILT